MSASGRELPFPDTTEMRRVVLNALASGDATQIEQKWAAREIERLHGTHSADLPYSDAEIEHVIKRAEGDLGANARITQVLKGLYAEHQQRSQQPEGPTPHELRQRIAEISRGGDIEFGPPTDYDYALADAVLKALGHTQQAEGPARDGVSVQQSKDARIVAHGQGDETTFHPLGQPCATCGTQFSIDGVLESDCVILAETYKMSEDPQVRKLARIMYELLLQRVMAENRAEALQEQVDRLERHHAEQAERLVSDADAAYVLTRYTEKQPAIYDFMPNENGIRWMREAITEWLNGE